MSVRSNYLHRVMDPQNYINTMDKLLVCAQLIEKHRAFDAIAFTGMSGATVGCGLAAWLGKSILMVRKPNDDTHSMYSVEGNVHAKRYLIVDDLVSTGGTIRTVMEKLRKETPASKCVGVMVYSSTTEAGRRRDFRKKVEFDLFNANYLDEVAEFLSKNKEPPEDPFFVKESAVSL